VDMCALRSVSPPDILDLDRIQDVLEPFDDVSSLWNPLGWTFVVGRGLDSSRHFRPRDTKSQSTRLFLGLQSIATR
jgi:hypothetical protein